VKNKSKSSAQSKEFAIRVGRALRRAARTGPSHRARLRRAALRLAEWQGSRREALTGSPSALTQRTPGRRRKGLAR